MGTGTRGFAVLAGALALAVGFTALSPAIAAQSDDYPSWDQVEAAKGNQAATASTIATINTLLAGLQAEAARLGDEAVRRSAEADNALRELDKATATARALASQASAAADAARKSADRAGAIVAVLYRSGGTDLTGRLLFSPARSDSKNPSDLLYQLGALDKLGGQVNATLQQAEADRNQASALSEQSAAAKTERDKRSVAAQAAAASAQSAADAANAAVASQQANLEVLYQQLADLKNTTAQLEQAYQVGLQAGDNNGGGGGSGSVDVPGDGINDPAGAQAYAWALLASYGFGGEQDSCLLWLWNRESGWRTNAYNESSGAYGIPQSLPGSKMAIVGADWRTNFITQVNWGVMYIVDRYGNPCGAWAHSESVGWY